jgi:predicted DNA-binding transcriptional regulator YafY
MLDLVKSMVSQPTQQICFQYKNWRGETSRRIAIPIGLWFGRTDWHPNDQWFMKALDVEKDEERDFALVDMKFL